MVGPSIDSKGGISTVVRGYREAGLFDRWGVVYLDSHVEGSRLRKLSVALRSLGKVVVMLASRRVALLHVHVAVQVSFWRKVAYIAVALVARCPVVFHLHGGRFMVFFHEQCGVAGRAVARLVLRRSAYVIALSEQWKENVLSIEHRANVVRIVNFVSVGDDRIGDFNATGPVLLFLGLLGSNKGIYDLLVAVSRLRERFPEIVLKCGGKGEVEEVSSRVSKLGIADNVELLGWVFGDKKKQLFAEAAVYVLPSYNEGMPMSILEAMAHGLPVVATRVGGIPEVVDSGEDGFLVDAGDVDGLVAAIESLLSDAALRTRMGARARRKVVERFSSEAVIPQVEAIYRSLGAQPVMPAGEASVRSIS